MNAPTAHRPFAVALCNEVLRDRPFEAQCELAAALGYDALEVAPFTLGDDPATLAPARVAELRRAAEAAGIRVSGLHWLLTAPPGLSITSADAALRARTLAHMHAMIDLCAALGGDVLVHGSPDQRRLSDDDPQGDTERGRAAFADVAEHAHRAGVHYLIEPLSPQETRFVTSWAEAAAIVRAVGHPGLRTMIDTRAARLGESEPVTTVLERGLRDGTVAHVHLNDRNRRGPGQGDDGFADVVGLLLREGYAGTVAVEPFDYHPDGATAAARAIGYLQGLVEALAAASPAADAAPRE
ncbi:MAG: sugar phosphate isomerase/epimerase family protein [Trueperaceae bacterium]